MTVLSAHEALLLRKAPAAAPQVANLAEASENAGLGAPDLVADDLGYMVR